MKSYQTKLRMPAEWEPHASTWLAWPHYRGDWPGKFEPIPWVYAEIIRHLGRHERVDLIVNNAASEKQARKILSKANALSKNVSFHRWPTNRVWTRDSGCTFVLWPCGRGRLARAVEPACLSAITWRFNAWAKYSNYQHDEKIGSRMAKAAARQRNPPASRQIAGRARRRIHRRQRTRHSADHRRMPAQQNAATQSGDVAHDYEKLFADYLGVQKVIWLGSGIAGDDTHGHVDDITRFVSPDTVVTVVESNPSDPNYEPFAKTSPPARRHRSGRQIA